MTSNRKRDVTNLSKLLRNVTFHLRRAKDQYSKSILHLFTNSFRCLTLSGARVVLAQIYSPQKRWYWRQPPRVSPLPAAGGFSKNRVDKLLSSRQLTPSCRYDGNTASATLKFFITLRSITAKFQLKFAASCYFSIFEACLLGSAGTSLKLIDVY